MKPCLALCTACLMLFAAACDKKGSTDGPSGTPEGGGDYGATSGLELAEQTFEFEERRNADQRKLMITVKGQLPKGWAPDPKAKVMASSKTLIPPQTGKKNVFQMSNVTISSTCHGQCKADKYAENIKGVTEQHLKFAGKDGKVLKDEEVRPGVKGFVIEVPGRTAKSYTIGVSHWQPGWPRIAFCNAHVQGDFADHWQAIYDACGKLDVSVVDPMMPPETLKAEAANLAKCPKVTSLTYVPEPARDGEPTEFGEVKAVHAHASRPGNVGLYIANFDMQATPSRKSPLAGEQRVAKFWLEHRKEGEVLSGRYAVKYDVGDTRVNPGLMILEGRTLQWSAGAAEGGVEIIARTPDKICGKIDISGGRRGSLKGEFVAVLEIGRGK